MKTGSASWLLATIFSLVLTAPGDGLAIPRDQVMVRARAFAFHPWRCSTANLTASCKPGYQSAYQPGDYLGLPYDWGGYMTLFEFDQQIASGAGAGSYSSDGELTCTAGLDCSGYVSKCWDAGHYSTSTLHQISSAIAQADLLPGDVLNKAGYHVVLYSHTLASGSPVFFEAAGYNVHISHSTWSYVSGYTPRRYQKITGSSAGNPTGTLDSPILIGSFPYTDARSTALSASDVLDGCGAAPAINESGPEVIYQATFSAPGTLTASVSDDAGTDVDIHLYGAANTGDCLARHDSSISVPVDCGSYLLVVDTFRSAAGVELPGAYGLTATFTPSGKSCGSGPATYAPGGKLGQPCEFPGNPTLPFCNENFGAEICLYTATESFCSKACQSSTDCSAFAGGCCKAIKAGELYCHPAPFCPKPDGGVPVDGRPRETGTGDAAAPVLDLTTPGDQPDSSSTLDGAPAAEAGGEPPGSAGGCSCAIQGASAGGGRWPAPGLLLLLALALGVRRRRQVACRRPARKMAKFDHQSDPACGGRSWPNCPHLARSGTTTHMAHPRP